MKSLLLVTIATLFFACLTSCQSTGDVCVEGSLFGTPVKVCGDPANLFNQK